MSVYVHHSGRRYKLLKRVRGRGQSGPHWEDYALYQSLNPKDRGNVYTQPWRIFEARMTPETGNVVAIPCLPDDGPEAA